MRSVIGVTDLLSDIMAFAEMKFRPQKLRKGEFDVGRNGVKQ